MGQPFIILLPSWVYPVEVLHHLLGSKAELHILAAAAASSRRSKSPCDHMRDTRTYGDANGLALFMGLSLFGDHFGGGGRGVEIRMFQAYLPQK